jgi:hypothetical protein
MEEKKLKKLIDKKFYYLSSFNIIPCLILGNGLTLDALVLVGALIVLVLNHTVLVNIVKSVTEAATAEGKDASRSLGRILILMGLKFSLLFGLIALIYLYKKALITKLFAIIFFQLIIQVVSIKNNYQNS